MLRGYLNSKLARAPAVGLLPAFGAILIAAVSGLAAGPAESSRKDQPQLAWPQPPAAARIEFVQSFSNAADFGWKRSLWRRFVDWVKNDSDPSILRRPFALAVDADGRIIIADTGARDVKIFDPKKKSVRFIRGYRGHYFGVPASVATDDARNIYISDSGGGRVLKFSPQGKFLDFIGGEEGAFQRPASIAFNPANRLLYVVDTTRPRIFAFSTDGRLVHRFGERGSGPGQFNFPTFIAVDRAGRLFVNDTLNFRVQVFTAEGKFLHEFGEAGDGSGNLNRPKGLALDSEGHLYIAEALFSAVQVFDREGRFLIHFGREGTGAGEFYIPAGLAIDRADRIYVADPYRRRVEIFQYRPAAAPARRSPADDAGHRADGRSAAQAGARPSAAPGGAW
jgi:sugar lactone lactonase YvrE